MISIKQKIHEYEKFVLCVHDHKCFDLRKLDVNQSSYEREYELNVRSRNTLLLAIANEILIALGYNKQTSADYFSKLEEDLFNYKLYRDALFLNKTPNIEEIRSKMLKMISMEINFFNKNITDKIYQNVVRDIGVSNAPNSFYLFINEYRALVYNSLRDKA